MPERHRSRAAHRALARQLVHDLLDSYLEAEGVWDWEAHGYDIPQLIAALRQVQQRYARALPAHGATDAD